MDAARADAAARMEAAAARMEAAAAEMEAAAAADSQKGKGKGKDSHGEAWHETKRQRAEQHRKGQQPPRTVDTPMCGFCKKNQPSQYCAIKACRNCCDGRVDHCRYHGYG